MFKMYFKIAMRSFQRNKLFSALSLIGLAVGMAGAILIFLWASNMLSYDRFHKDESQLYVLGFHGKVSGEMKAWKWTPKILGPALLKETPEVQYMSRFDNNWDFVLTGGGKVMQGKNGGFADPDFFKMFNFPFVKGGMNQAWQDGNGVILTDGFAKSLFGQENAIGKEIKIDSVNYVKVTGILKDFPANTLFDCNYLLSWGYAKKINALDQNWFNNNVQTFIKVAPGVPTAALNNKIKDFVSQHNNNPTYDYQLMAEPLSRNFLYDKDENGQFVAGRIVLVRSVLLIGLFLIIIACINFMNLSTAQSVHRAKEVGVKKAIGASRRKLIIQFFVESLILSFISFLIAVGIAFVVLPYFNQMVATNLKLHVNLRFIVGSLAFVLITGMMAGAYPALYLSSFKPLKVLNGRFKRLQGGFNLRAVLVVVQFTISIVLILGTIMIISNNAFVRSRDIGYKKAGLLYTALSGNLDKNYLPLRNALLNSGAVLAVTKSMSAVTMSQSNGWGVSWPGARPKDKHTQFLRFSSDADMVHTLGMQLIKGRDIDIYQHPGDSNAMVLTETAVKTMRLNRPIGAVVVDNGVHWHVVGVIKDFVIDQPAEHISPMLIEGPKAWFGVVHYRLNPANSIRDNLDRIKTIFDKFNPGFPFEYAFVDQSFQKKFEEVERYGQIASLSAGLTIFIACLGLFGLMSYMTEAKMKEISIRKVLGASTDRIMLLLTKGLLSPLLISFVISIPIALFVMDKWLSKFDYRVNISAWWFIEALLATLLIATATIFWQAWRAANINPVKNLKTE